jgi:hypothetical protein
LLPGIKDAPNPQPLPERAGKESAFTGVCTG